MSAVSKNFRLTTVGFVAFALAMGAGRFAYTPLLPMMREEGLLTVSDGSLVASIHFLGYWMGAIIAAKVPLAPRTLLRASVLICGAATLVMGWVESVAVIAALRWVVGVCSAWVLVLVGNFIVRTLAESGRSVCQGIVFSGVGGGIALVGLACLAFMVAGIDSATSWRIVGMVCLVVAAAVCFALGSEFPRTREPRAMRGRQRRPLVWPMLVGYGVAGMGYIVPATYLPLMARDIVSDPLIFGWSWPIFGLAAFASTLVAARFRRLYSDRSIWAACQLVMAGGIVLPVLFPHIVGVALSGLLVGGTFMIVTMAGMQEAHRVAPQADAIRHIASMTAAFATGQMVGPIFAGSVYAITESFDAILLASAAAVAATAAMLVFVPSPKEPVRDETLSQ